MIRNQEAWLTDVQDQKKKVCNVDSGLPADILELLRSGIGDARDDGKRTRICS